MTQGTGPVTAAGRPGRSAAVLRAAPRAGCLIVAALVLQARVQAQDAGALLARHDAMRDALAASPFQRPLVLESIQTSNNLKGEVYAVVDKPFAVVGPALQSIEHWCDLLMLHLNVKACATQSKAPTAVLTLVVGRKYDQPPEDAYKVEFNYPTPVVSSDYLRVQMAAAEGPLSTRDYRLSLEAVPIDDKHSFVHMSYAYAYGTAARFAMQAYLATAGRDKVGFSITGKTSDGKPTYIDGVRGVVERNTMRYYLAIETYLASLGVPVAEQTEKRLRDWFAATERYPQQLHEMERDEYLTMKRNEVQRQLAAKQKSN